MWIVVSSIIDDDSVEADEAELSNERLLCEAGREGEGLLEATAGGRNWYKKMHASQSLSHLKDTLLTFYTVTEKKDVILSVYCK